MSENRRWARTSPKGLVSPTGMILLEPNGDPILCTVVDLSLGGACLVPARRLEDVPQRFVFVHGGVRKVCMIAWRRGCRIGVSFQANTEKSVSSVGLSRSSRDSRLF